jgi:hypothetical protein
MLTKDMAVVVSHAIEARGGGLVTIEDGSQLLAKQRWDAVGNVINDYWKSFLNYTHYRTP